MRPRKPYLWRLVWLPFALGALIFLLLPIHESVLGTDVNCGGAFSAIDKTATQAAIDAGIGDIAQNIADECNSDGKTHLYIAGGIVIAGLSAGGSGQEVGTGAHVRLAAVPGMADVPPGH